ncbi:MAG TPA: DoxX family membrane protein [Methylomirabilota bacterium]|nr:DoxX family membrane protein [Methylomirabilota bacterium]
MSVTATDVGILIVRLAIGLTFAAHGAQKVLGWWGGRGFAGWTGGIARMGAAPRALVGGDLRRGRACRRPAARARVPSTLGGW